MTFSFEDVRPQGARGAIGHQRGDRILVLELHRQGDERHGHLLHVAEAHPDPGPAELDGEPCLALLDAVRHVVGLDLLRAAPVNARRLVGHQRVAEGSPDDRAATSAPGGSGHRWGRRPAPGSNRNRNHLATRRTARTRVGVHVLLAHPPVAGEALDALVEIHRGPVDGRIDVDGPHRTDGDAVGARDTLLGVNLHVALLFNKVRLHAARHPAGPTSSAEWRGQA